MGWLVFFKIIVKFLFFLILTLITYVLIGIPFCLIIDFSFRFINFLRGIAGTSSLAVEFTFDYINFAAFLLRTFVQNVRFLLILIVCYSLSELMYKFDCSCILILDVKTGMDNFTGLPHNWDYSNLKLMYHIFSTIVYLLYELLHTFFIAIVQFSAFLIMVF
jgi:hypothetical protein